MSPTTTSPLRVAVEGVPFEPNWFFGGVSLYMREVLRLFAHDPSVSFHVFAKELHPEAASFLDDLGIPCQKNLPFPGAVGVRVPSDPAHHAAAVLLLDI